ncbi:hypothetical protein GCM10027403_04320 [Arthrobacter tecti]
MSSSGGSAPGAGSAGPGFDGAGPAGAAFDGAGSAGVGWDDSGTVGPIWEGTDVPAPAGPWGMVELPPAGALEELGDAVTTLQSLNELQCWADAQKARLVDRIRELYTLQDQDTSTYHPSRADDAKADELATSRAAAEIGALLRLPDRTATVLVEQSRMLIHQYQHTLTSLEAGKLSWRHAITVAEECGGIAAEAASKFEKDLVERAEQTTVAKVSRLARGLREVLHPEAAPVRRARAITERRVVFEHDLDGMAWLSAYLPAEQACGIYQRLDAGARALQAPDEERTLTQLRADVFADVLTHTCAGEPTAGTGFRGINATVHLTVPVTTLLDYGRTRNAQIPGGTFDGEDTSADTGDQKDSVTFHPGSRDPVGGDSVAGGSVGGDSVAGGSVGGDSVAGGSFARASIGRTGGFPVLEGYGPIDADTAARLAGHAPSFMRILTHPETGAALSIGRETYRPPKHLQDWVRIRDKTCRHPGCNRAASSCELDHTIPWHQGGGTCHGNLQCLCRKHHARKSDGGWMYSQPAPGIITATSPAGKIYTSKPPPF